MNGKQAAIRTHQLTASYGGKPALWNVSTDIPAGQLTGILGPNGAGKSTLLKCILGALPTLSGTVEFPGCSGDAKSVLRSIGYVPQRSSVDWDFPICVLDLVQMGTYGQLKWFQRPGKQQREQALAALREVEMEEFSERQIGELSGGQQQRVFLARAFAQDAQTYLLDEPFAGVDAKTETLIIDILRRMQSYGHTIAMVHHDLTTVRAYFDHVILLNKQLVASGPTPQAFTSESIQQAYGVVGELEHRGRIGHE